MALASLESVTTSQSADPSVFRLPAYSCRPGVVYQLQVTAASTLSGTSVSSEVVEVRCVDAPLRIAVTPYQSVFNLPMDQNLTVGIAVRRPVNVSGVSYSAAVHCQPAAHIRCAVEMELQERSATEWRLVLWPSSTAVVSAVAKVTVQVCDAAGSRGCARQTLYVSTVEAQGPMLTVPASSSVIRASPVSVPREVTLVAVARFAANTTSATSMDRFVLGWRLASPSLSSLNASHRAYASWLELKSSLNATHRTVAVLPSPRVREVAVPLKLPSGALVGSTHYVFQLFGWRETPSGSRVGSWLFAETEVWTNEGPWGGDVALTPSAGMALTTLFAAAAPRWTDRAEDLPLSYSFSVRVRDLGVSAASVVWASLPGHRSLSFLEAVRLPRGNASSSSTLAIRCVVSDAFGAATASPIVMVTVAPQTMTAKLTTRQLTVWNAALTEVAFETLIARLQFVQALLLELRQQAVNASLIAPQRTLVHGMLRLIVNGTQSSLDTADRWMAVELAAALHDEMNRLAQAQATSQAASLLGALTSLSIGSGSTNGTAGSGEKAAQLSQAVTGATGALTQTLLSLPRSAGGTQTLQAATETVRVSLALITTPVSNSSAQNGSTAVVFLPAISLPQSQTTISVGQSATGGSGALVSVVEVDAAVWEATAASTGSGGGAGSSSDLQLSSSVVSVRVTPLLANGSLGGVATAPVFVASLSVAPLLSSVPFFSHNCTVGVAEWRSFLCPESNVLMNVSCSGEAAAVVHRRCPVPQRVCGVLSLTGGEANRDYCQATTSSDGATVVCSCGLNAHSQNASSVADVALGGAVNVAVMTQFVTGGFSGAVLAADGTLTQGFAQQSMAIFAAFGCLWGLGLMVVALHVTRRPDTAKSEEASVEDKQAPLWRRLQLPLVGALQTKSALSLVVPATPMAEPSPLERYVHAALPAVFLPAAWPRRLWLQLATHHRYISAVLQLLERDTAHDERRRKESVLQVLHLLAAVTLACFVLALFFDQQYPVDDGSCGSLKDRVSCLARHSTVDPSRTYCLWHEATQPSPGTWAESRGGVVLRRVTLESILTDSTTTVTGSCVFDDAPPSSYVVLLAVMLTTTVSMPLQSLLNYLFRILEAEPKQRLLTRIAAQEALKRQQLSVDAISPSPGGGMASSSLSHRWKHRRAVLPSAVVAASEDVSRLPALVEAGESSPPSAPGSWYSTLQHRLSLLQTVEAAPVVPQELRQVRRRAVEAKAVFASWQASFAAPQSIRAATRTVGEGDEAADEAEEATNRRVVQLVKRLHHATEAEAGLCLLQTLVGDLLAARLAADPHDSRRSATARAALFEAVVQHSFVTHSSVDQRAQWLVGGVLGAATLGALFFVALKGATRGLDWQLNLLRVCLVEWSVKVLFHETVSVYMVHFLVPNTLYGDVEAAALGVVSAASARGMVVPGLGEGESQWRSVRVAATKPGVWEAALVQHVARQGATILSTLTTPPEAVDGRLATRFLRWLATQSVATQATVSFAISSSIFGVMFVTWIALRPLGAMGALAMTALVLAIFGASVAVWWRCHEGGPKSRWLPVLSVSVEAAANYDEEAITPAVNSTESGVDGVDEDEDKGKEDESDESLLWSDYVDGDDEDEYSLSFSRKSSTSSQFSSAEVSIMVQSWVDVDDEVTYHPQRSIDPDMTYGRPGSERFGSPGTSFTSRQTTRAASDRRAMVFSPNDEELEVGVDTSMNSSDNTSASESLKVSSEFDSFSDQSLTASSIQEDSEDDWLLSSESRSTMSSSTYRR